MAEHLVGPFPETVGAGDAEAEHVGNGTLHDRIAEFAEHLHSLGAAGGRQERVDHGRELRRQFFDAAGSERACHEPSQITVVRYVCSAEGERQAHVGLVGHREVGQVLIVLHVVVPEHFPQVVFRAES